jgi:flagellar basal body-associated protein FliL
MAEEKTAKREERAPVEEKKTERKQSNRLLLIGIIAGIVVFNAIIAIVLIQVTKPKDPDEATEEMRADSLRQHSEKMSAIGAFSDNIDAVVNIAETDGERFLKIVVKLEFDDKKYSDLAEEIEKRLPKFKSILIDQVSHLTLADLNEPDAKLKICRNFQRVVNNTLPPEKGEVFNVVLDEFIVQ